MAKVDQSKRKKNAKRPTARPERPITWQPEATTSPPIKLTPLKIAIKISIHIAFIMAHKLCGTALTFMPFHAFVRVSLHA